MILRRHPENPDRKLLGLLKSAQFVGIHGAQYSGKSSLARELATLTGGTHIEIDKHLSDTCPEKPYLEQLQLTEVQAEIRASQPPIFLDCLILLDVLDKLQIQTDVNLFCQRSNDENCCFDRELESAFAAYCHRHHPRNSASVVFTLVYSH